MNHEARLQELKLELARLGDRGSKLWRGVEHERGREAEHPAAIPPRGWRDILVRAWREVSDENLFLLAGGVTYAILLALFPGLAALVALYGLVFDATQIEKQVSALSGFVPGQTEEILSQELHGLVESSNGSLGFAAALGLLLALWSASRGMSGLVSAINTAYGEKERRGFLKLNLIVIGLTLGLLIGGTLTIALVAVLPAAIQFLAVGSATKWLLLIVQWPLLIVLVMVALGVLYRFCPDRNKPQWRWVSPGAIAATVLWIVASIGFTIYCRSSIEKSQFLPDRNVTPAADDFIRHTAP